MRFIPTRVHGIVDYLMGVLLILLPWLLGFAQGGAETSIPVILGAGALLYSIFTDYELGIVRRLPMSTHLTLDAMSGALLAVSPWLFGFADHVYLPHLILGIVEIMAALTTHKVPADARAARREV